MQSRILHTLPLWLWCEIQTLSAEFEYRSVELMNAFYPTGRLKLRSIYSFRNCQYPGCCIFQCCSGNMLQRASVVHNFSKVIEITINYKRYTKPIKNNLAKTRSIIQFLNNLLPIHRRNDFCTIFAHILQLKLYIIVSINSLSRSWFSWMALWLDVYPKYYNLLNTGKHLFNTQ